MMQTDSQKLPKMKLTALTLSLLCTTQSAYGYDSALRNEYGDIVHYYQDGADVTPWPQREAWEYGGQSCLRDDPPRANFQDRELLNGFIDLAKGSVELHHVDYTSGHNVLPLILERKYFSGPHKQGLKTKWFFNNHYHLDLADSIKSATDVDTSSVCADGKKGGRPAYLTQGLDGVTEIYAEETDDSTSSARKFNWYVIKSKGNYKKIDLQINSDGYVLHNAEKGQIETYQLDGRIKSIKDVGSQITLTWTYSTNSTKITRTGGAFLEYKEIGEDIVVTTSTGKKYIYKSSVNNPSKVIFPDGKSISYRYDSKDYLISEFQNSEKVKSFTWESDGRLKSAKIGADGTYTFNSNISYRQIGSRTLQTGVVKVTNPKGRVTQTEISNSGGEAFTVRSVSGSGGGLPSSKVTFTNSNSKSFANTQQITNQIGIKSSVRTDSRGWEVERREAIGKPEESYVKTTWLTKWKMPRIIETNKSKVTYTYLNESTRPLVNTKIVYDKVKGETQVTRYYYKFHSNGVISEVKEDGPRTNVSDISFEYFDTKGRLVKQRNALGHETIYSNFTSDGRAQKINYADGSYKLLNFNVRGWLESERLYHQSKVSTTLYKYDELGRVTEVTDPTGIVTKKVYTSSGEIESEVVSNHGRAFDYDSLGKIAKEKKGFVDSYIYNLNGTESCESTPDSIDSNYNCHVYSTFEAVDESSKKSIINDALGRQTKVIDAYGNQTENIYDTLGRLVQVKDADATPIETLTYDNLSRVKTKTDALGRRTTYGYDTDGNVTSIRDNASRLFTFSYNGLGELTNSISPATGNTSYTYDNGGNLDLVTLNDGKTIDHSYDSLNRLISRKLSDQSTAQIFTYDLNGTVGKGKLGKVTDNSGSTEFFYNDLNSNITKVKYRIESSLFEVHYTYDNAGRIKTLRYPSGYTITYHRDSKTGGINRISYGSTNLISNIQYKPFGPVSSFYSQGSGQNNFTVDKNYRVTGVQSQNYDVIYSYDGRGLITKKDDRKDNKNDLSYIYKDNYELFKETSNFNSQSLKKSYQYSYDVTGNRLKQYTIEQHVEFEPEPWTFDKYSSGGPSYSEVVTKTNSYSYNGNGQMSVFNGNSVGKDARGNVTSDRIHGVLTTRKFNALNQMIESNYNGSKTTYKYNALGYRTVKNGRYGKVYFIYDMEGRLLAEALNGVIKKEYIYLGNKLVIVRKDRSSNFFVQSDVSGRPEYVTDQSKNVKWKAHNNAFDRVVTYNQIGDLNIGYPGQYYDKETDTWYNINRDYDAKAGRYLQSDPMGTVDGPNTYVYVGNNPVNKVDPSGEFAWSLFFGAVDIGYQLYTKGEVDVEELVIAAAGGRAVTLLNRAYKKVKSFRHAQNNTKPAPQKNELAENNGNATKAAPKLLTHVPKNILFKGDEAIQHFGIHGDELMKAFGRSSYNLKNYVDDANHVIQKGTFVPEMNGYVRLIGGKGSAKYGFVGLDRATGNITTFHAKSVSELARKAPSLGLSK